MKLFLSILFLLCFGCIYASTDNNAIGARSAGLANASIGISDIWATHHNQAGIAFINKAGGGLYYENRFLLPELGLKGGVAVLPTKGGVFGLSTSSLGYSAYSESKIGLAYGKKLGENFAVGVQMDYLFTHIAENYGSKGAFVAEVGIMGNLTKKLVIGAHVFNPNKAKLTVFNDERIPTIMKVGLLYHFSDKVFGTIEAEKDIDHKPLVKSGIEYKLNEMFYLRAGVATNPFLNTFGFGLFLNNFQLDVASSFHSVLGFSPRMSLTYKIK